MEMFLLLELISDSGCEEQHWSHRAPLPALPESAVMIITLLAFLFSLSDPQMFLS